MARSLDQVISSLPAKRRAKIEKRAAELASLTEHIAATRPARAKQPSVGKRARSQSHRASESRPGSRRQATRS